ncbi:MAG: methylmalonyl-CoA mutase family protein, partial [Gemmatimonadetes bacterium]|nr:methylmalonyl-CoA mutase family protein [Gemmatimonadota bacterium]
EEAGEKQSRRLSELRARRDEAVVARCLERLAEAAREEKNLMPPMLDAARAYTTLGELRSALEAVYGRFKEPVSF